LVAHLQGEFLDLAEAGDHSYSFFEILFEIALLPPIPDNKTSYPGSSASYQAIRSACGRPRRSLLRPSSSHGVLCFLSWF
jgi:hypothetical protein